MVNDGGLADVIETAEQVANNLSLLSSSGYGDDGHSSSAAGAKRKPSRSLSEVSNNTEHSTMDLSRHTSTELDPIVSPLIQQLEKINAAELLSLNPTTDGVGATLNPSKRLSVTPIHDFVSPQYEDQTTNNIVRYLHVSELSNKYSAGIFVFPPNTFIPLHDHPGMIVISRVLYGELTVQSYDVLPEEDDIDSNDDSSGHSKRTRYDKTTTPTTSVSLASNSRQPSVLRASFNKIKDFISRTFSHYDTEGDEDPSILRVKPNLNPRGVVRRQSSSVDDDDDTESCQMMISAPNVTCLYPHKGNCHSFRAGPNGAAVLDILLPPYDSDDRDCTFYETNIEHEKYSREEQHVKSYTLTSISQPEDFHCLGGSYGRFGTCKDCE